MTRIPPMLGIQLDLFPEPAHAQAEPAEYRWTVFEPEDEDYDPEDKDVTLIEVDAGDDLETLRDNYDDFDTWLRDNVTGRLYDPHDWPENDAVDHAALHVINTLGANGFLAALADRADLVPVTP